MEYWSTTAGHDPLAAYNRTPAIYHCPVQAGPGTELYSYRQVLYARCVQRSGAIAAAPETVIAYCTMHGERGGSLESESGGASLRSGFYMAARMNGAVSRIPARAVKMWWYLNNRWLTPPLDMSMFTPGNSAEGCEVFPDEPFPLQFEPEHGPSGTI